MTRSKSQPSPGAMRGEPLRQHVLDAAEQLLCQGKAEFSMRDLAAEAGVSFATPFNQFGSKAAIMHALSARRIETMAARFGGMPHPADATARVLLAIDTAVEVMLEEPEVNRAVMGHIGAAGMPAGTVLAHSASLWALALGRKDAWGDLPRQLAFAFRGVLSFWTAGELSDQEFTLHAHQMAKTILLGIANE